MFQGFTDETVDFMWGIRFNNERTWFEANKEIYLTHFQRPMRELCGEVYEYLNDKRPELGLVCKVSRIYRDARRLFGRGPYKDHLWFVVSQPKSEEGETRPTLWFELGPEGWDYGLGYWQPKPVIMQKLRNRIARDPDTMRKLMAEVEKRGEFRLWTDSYKRPKGAAPSEDLAVWFSAKSMMLGHSEPLTEELFHPELAERLKKGLESLLPFYEYLASLPGEPDPDEMN
jgi:uncharacterized protein (TIGR02453 family)